MKNLKFKRKETKKQQSSGITLIALVITIIVLLILAGISISMLSRDNSILQRATQAKKATDEATAKEQILVAVLGSYSETTKLDIEKLKSNLETTGATVIGDSFPITAIISGKKYTVENDGNVQEVNENVVTIAELQENPSTYFGYDVINYTESLPEELKETLEDNNINIEWQLFYAGKVDANDSEEEARIYLISKDYIPYLLLPAKNGAQPVAVSGSIYKAKFSSLKSNPTDINDGVIQPSFYAGSESIATDLQKYNRDYFITNNYSSTKPNMKAVAYMMDISIWNKFKGEKADYVIGGPSVELLFTAYNKYTGTTNYKAKATSETGYGVNTDGSTTFSLSIDSGSITNSAVPYTVNGNSNAAGYWLASPCDGGVGNAVMRVHDTGEVNSNGYNSGYIGFRPLVCLQSGVQLEEVNNSNNNAFLIVMK